MKQLPTALQVLLLMLAMRSLASAQTKLEVRLVSLPETEEFLVTISNQSPSDVHLWEYRGMLGTLEVEIWYGETGVAACPKSIEELSSKGAFTRTEDRVLKQGASLDVRLKWSDLTATLEDNKIHLMVVFSSGIYMPDSVFARAFLRTANNTQHPSWTRFESELIPVFAKKKKNEGVM